MGSAVIKPNTSFLNLTDEELEFAIRAAYNEDPEKMQKVLEWGVDVSAREQFSKYANALDDETMDIITATVPALEAHGVDITKRMYHLLFAQNPETKILFASRAGAIERREAQAIALAQAVLAYAQNIRNLSVLGEAVGRMTTRHVAVNVKPFHYNIVAGHLIQALKDVLKEAATDEILNAWAKGYYFLAHLLVEAEENLRKEKENEEGGWRGFKSFIIDDINAISDDVKTITLKPSDGGRVPGWIAGQFITIKLFNDENVPFIRNYSLSYPENDNHDSFLISVKREENGLGSNILHNMNKNDSIDIIAPFGNFHINTVESNIPVVFCGAGIGVTCLHAMIQSCKDNNKEKEEVKEGERNIYWLNGAKNLNKCYFKDNIDELSLNNDHIHSHYFLSGDEEQEGDNITKSRMNASMILDKINDDDKLKAHFFVCGPESYMSDIINGLKENNISSENIHREFYGPTQNI